MEVAREGRLMSILSFLFDVKMKSSLQSLLGAFYILKHYRKENYPCRTIMKINLYIEYTFLYANNIDYQSRMDLIKF